MDEQGGLVIVQRDEGALLRANVAYHLLLGFRHIVVVDNHSTDAYTREVLNEISRSSAVTILADSSSFCDQAKLANWGLEELLTHRHIDWVFPCDADEFISFDGGLQHFLQRCRREHLLYGTIRWLNHIPESGPVAHDPVHYLTGTLFYSPFAERRWQSEEHFRKAFCHRHSGMQIVVGGHFFSWQANASFFVESRMTPQHVCESTATLFHYEMRDCAEALLRKWSNLGHRHCPGASLFAGPWREKEARMLELWTRYETNPAGAFEWFARGRRTVWGTEIPLNRMTRHSTVASVIEALA